MARVSFTTKKGAQKIVVGGKVDLASVEGAVNAKDYSDESHVPKASKDDFKEVTDLVDALYKERRDTLYFYCDEGKMRSPTLAGIYMLRLLGYKWDDAIEELEERIRQVHGDSWSDCKKRVTTWLQAYAHLVQGEPEVKRHRRTPSRLGQ